MLFALRRVGPLLLRHACGYVDLIAAEAQVAAATVKKRLFLAAVGVVSTLLGLALLVAWLIAATWDSPYRLWVIGGFCAAFVAMAFASLRMAVAGRGEMFERLKAEWAADRELRPGAGPALSGELHD